MVVYNVFYRNMVMNPNTSIQCISEKM